MGKVRLPEFLQQQLQPKEGDVVLIENDHPIYENALVPVTGTLDNLAHRAQERSYKPSDGRVVGRHQGAHYYTIGQRKGLGIGGFEHPLFVIGTDTITNTIYVGHSDQHPGLYRSALFIPEEDLHWVREDQVMAIGESREYMTRIRYRQDLEPSTLLRTKEGLYIDFMNPQRGVAKGQFAAWYAGEELIGSGVIA